MHLQVGSYSPSIIYHQSNLWDPTSLKIIYLLTDSSFNNNDHGKTATWKAKQLELKYKEDFKKMVRDKWKEKAMHGKFPNYLDKDHVDVELSFK